MHLCLQDVKKVSDVAKVGEFDDSCITNLGSSYKDYYITLTARFASSPPFTQKFNLIIMRIIQNAVFINLFPLCFEIYVCKINSCRSTTLLQIGVFQCRLCLCQQFSFSIDSNHVCPLKVCSGTV